MSVRQANGHKLMPTGAGHKGFGGVRQDYHIGRSRAVLEDGAHASAGRIHKADRIASVVRHDDRISVGSYARFNGLFARSDLRHLSSGLQINHRNRVGTGVGNVRKLAVGIKVNRKRLSMQRNRRRNRVAFRIHDGQ